MDFIDFTKETLNNYNIIVTHNENDRICAKLINDIKGNLKILDDAAILRLHQITTARVNQPGYKTQHITPAMDETNYKKNYTLEPPHRVLPRRGDKLSADKI